MVETPLSDAITAVLEDNNKETYAAFLQVFCESRLGIIARGLPDGASGLIQTGTGVTLAAVAHPEAGGEYVLACADMAVFVTRFDRSFNAEIEAAALVSAALANPNAAGILINSATSEHSLVLERPTLERLLEQGDSRPRKPWWRFW